MALPKETILLGAECTYPECGEVLEPKVLWSPAGYYVGTRCSCGPYSHESGYFKDAKAATSALPFYRAAFSQQNN